MAKTVKTATTQEVAPRMGNAEPPKVTAEEKLNDMLAQAAADAALKAGEQAAATLNKVNKKTLDCWLKVGQAMIRIGELTNNNPKAIGAIVKTLPEFSAIPSPIRSNAKWLATEWDNVKPMIDSGILRGDHPTSLREQHRAHLASNQPADDEGEGSGEGNGSEEGDDNIAPAISIAKNYLDSLDEEGLRKWTMGLVSLLAEKPATRKLLLSVLPKVK